MFYTEFNPYTLKPVFVEKNTKGKALQRALLPYYEPRNAEKVVKALHKTHREDLIPLLVPGYVPKMPRIQPKNNGKKQGKAGRPIRASLFPITARAVRPKTDGENLAPRGKRK